MAMAMAVATETVRWVITIDIQVTMIIMKRLQVKLKNHSIGIRCFWIWSKISYQMKLTRRWRASLRNQMAMALAVAVVKIRLSKGAVGGVIIQMLVCHFQGQKDKVRQKDQAMLLLRPLPLILLESGALKII
jgi:hypothetical protein